MNEEIIKVYKLNQVYFKIECSLSQGLELKGFLEVYAPGYMWHPRFKNKIWNGKITFFDVGRSLLPIGLLSNFFTFCQKFNYEYSLEFDVNELSNDFKEEDLETYFQTIFDGSGIVLRDFQKTAVTKALTNKRGTLVSATGSGKSAIIYSIIRFLTLLDKKILLIVPSTSLVEQMFSDFKLYGWSNLRQDVSILYAGKVPDMSKKVLVSTWQSVYRKKEDFFSQFDCIMVDECQHAKSASIQSIGKKCSNAEYRLGFTGTLPTEKADLFNIFGYLGPKIFDLRAKELIDKGVLSNIAIANILLKYPKDVIQKNKARSYEEEVNTIMEYPDRNKIFDHLFKHIPDKQNTLILCHRIEHLLNIQQYLVNSLDEKYQIYVIYGDIKPEDRENIRKMMDSSTNVVLIGTYATMSTGVNIRKIHNIIFASSYKSKIKVLQSIGRGLRTDASKAGLVLFDLVDDMRWEKRTGTVGKNHVFLHFEERLKYYDEQGFEYSSMSFTL